jgi:hypothetical protein
MSGRQTAIAIAAWGAGLLVLAAVQWIWDSDAVSLAQLPAAVAGTLLLAGGALLLRDREVLDVPDASVGTAVLGAGLVLLGAAAAVGLWLAFLAGPLLILGLVSLAMERRA